MLLHRRAHPSLAANQRSPLGSSVTAYQRERCQHHPQARQALAGLPRASSSDALAGSAGGAYVDGADRQDRAREGRVMCVTCTDAVQLLNEGWVLLDVRPPDETTKARVVGAKEVPIFVPEGFGGVGSVLKNCAALITGGWWRGGWHMKPNPEFMEQVEAVLPDKSKPMLVGCQKGLRSLAACEMLAMAGYQRLAWISGGFDQGGRQIPTVGNIDVRHAGIGGLSEMLGWTEVQREEGEQLGQARVQSILRLGAILLLLDALVAGGMMLSGTSAPPPA